MIVISDIKKGFRRYLVASNAVTRASAIEEIKNHMIGLGFQRPLIININTRVPVFFIESKMFNELKLSGVPEKTEAQLDIIRDNYAV